MFLKKSSLFLVIVSFFVFACREISFSQEGLNEPAKEKLKEELKEELKESAPVEEGAAVKSEGAKAAYNAMEFVMKFTSGLNTPNKVTVLPDGSVCIADAGKRIAIFNESGELVDTIGDKQVEEGTEKIELRGLCSIDSDDRGNIYAASYRQPAVLVLNSKGTLLYKIPMNRAVQKRLPGAGPNAVLVNSRGDIYVSDQSNGMVSVYNMNGKYKYAIQSFKTKDGQKLSLARPSDMAVNSKDEVYMTDGIIFRIHRFNAKGNFLGSFGGQGDAAGLFVKMTSIAVDSKDRVYVLDSARSLIQVFTPAGDFLYALSNPDGGPLSIGMSGTLSIDKKTDLLYVSQGMGLDGVSVFRYTVAGAAKSTAPKK
jgi:DNA-binding beta-propeller fold protein YncE